MHGIKIATLKSGLSAHVIRMWEKRYAAVTPERTDTNRRLYDDLCIQRLIYLAKLTQNGHSIGQIANLPDQELASLCEELEPQQEPSDTTHESTIEGALEAIQRFDQNALESLFNTAVKEVGYSGLLEKILIPLIHGVGDAWHNGNFTTAEEHAATSFIKDYLCVSARSFSSDSGAPKLLITTPPGQLHELGAVIAASLARKQGWDVIYLGVSLPPTEIAGAAEKMGARAVVLSIVYPLDDLKINVHLETLRAQLDPNIPIIVGGAQSSTYQPVIEKLKLTQLNSIHQLATHLDALRH